MIKFVNYRSPSMSEDSLTFGRAASSLLTIVAEQGWVRAVPTKVVQVTVDQRPFGEYAEQDSRDAFRALSNFAWLLNELLWAEHDGPQTDLSDVRKIAEARSKQSCVPPLTTRSISTRHELVRYCCGWLVGREITGIFEDAEAIAGLLLAVQAEIDGEGPVEKTLAALTGP